ncbi:molybdopterin-dependent oxidoreductase [Salinibacterium sp.]|uniref:molybdopterin-dependent oxidoreductase n=1 Tax=Salinibacterium sp. TaxID=1915057 RepID=UPI00286BBD96|nr:molybdopterin-dependent oxidoreductase [Salinibacterium sp.]
MNRRRVTLWAAVTGVLAAVVTLAVAEAFAAFMATPGSSPLFAVGSAVVDLVPAWVKELVISLFGTGDKVALFVGLGLLVLVLAVVIGMLQYRRPPTGLIALATVGLVSVIAVASRAGAGPLWALPSLAGVFAGILVLRATATKLRDWVEATAPVPVPITPGLQSNRAATRVSLTRRRFFVLLGGTAAGAVVIGLGARALNAGTAAVNVVRDALVLPKPTTAAPAIPVAAELDIPGISPLISANDTFYRIDTALQVPVIDASTWKLRITGMVDNEIEIGFDELLALPMTEHSVTLMCVSNEVGGDLVGNATWLGYPIRELLKRAGPQAGADMVLSTSIDGFTAGTPLDVLLEDDRQSLLAVGMNGEPLPIEHGFPVRMVVPGLYGYVSATKWIVSLKVTTFAADMGYWTPRGWSALGPVKTASRIDVPASGTSVSAGTVAIAGVAWAQHRGVERVEVRVDDGAWQPATLAEAISIDTWRQWFLPWDAPSGSHTIAVRATGAPNDTQRENRVPVAPNGSEGYHTVTVTVA